MNTQREQAGWWSKHNNGSTLGKAVLLIALNSRHETCACFSPHTFTAVRIHLLYCAVSMPTTDPFPLTVESVYVSYSPPQPRVTAKQLRL